VILGGLAAGTFGVALAEMSAQAATIEGHYKSLWISMLLGGLLVAFLACRAATDDSLVTMLVDLETETRHAFSGFVKRTSVRAAAIPLVAVASILRLRLADEGCSGSTASPLVRRHCRLRATLRLLALFRESIRLSR
jgi:hypothetical protein